MYSINHDYLKLCEVIENSRNETPVYPGLKPFNPEAVEFQPKQDVAASENDSASVKEMKVIQFVPVPIIPIPVDSRWKLWPFGLPNNTEPKEISDAHLMEENELPMHITPSTANFSIPKPGRHVSRRLPGCGFCRTNGERSAFYMGHCLKDARGNVECPILRNYVCPQCQATGDRAHTVAYCPRGRNLAPITSIKSKRKSCGCRWTDSHCHCE